jgi:hypothetical protein
MFAQQHSYWVNRITLGSELNDSNEQMMWNKSTSFYFVPLVLRYTDNGQVH